MSTNQSGQTGKCPACKVEGVRLKDVNGLLICDKCSSKRFSSKVRKTIQEAFERQQAHKQAEAWRKRIDIAKRGVKLYEEGKLPDALRSFRDYLSILEARYGVSQGTLTVSHFKTKEEAGEILLIAGIYWDMAKIYDHMKGHTAELRFALNKFIEFSIERPHVILASEAIRKYIASGTAIHVQDFKNAHQLVVKQLSKCFIATSVFGPKSEEVAVLQKFRDQTLSASKPGKLFIESYYRVSPPIARLLLRFPVFTHPVRLSLTGVVNVINRLYR
ncbi:MAG: CFI-box-CTERM domain-containing protein [Bdellovibrionota bacterium]